MIIPDNKEYDAAVARLLHWKDFERLELGRMTAHILYMARGGSEADQAFVHELEVRLKRALGNDKFAPIQWQEWVECGFVSPGTAN